MTQLKLEQICHGYGGTQVLHNISLELDQGELLAILGASGSGKTTLLRTIAGFITPQQGSLHIGESTVINAGQNQIPTEHRNIGMVFQDHALFPHMTVHENIQFGIHESPHRQERADTLLKLVGLEGFGARLPGTLSGGQQQRVALARALAPKPTILLLDEPFANLDANLRSEMVVEVRNILKVQNITALMVTHDKNDALVMADQVAILDTPNTKKPSSLVQLDTPQNVYGQPANAVAAQLTGIATCLTATAQGQEASNALGPIPLRTEVHGECQVVVRPEDICFDEHENGDCQLSQKRFLGNQIQWTVQTPCGDVLLHTKSPCELSINSTGQLRFEKRCWAFKS